MSAVAPDAVEAIPEAETATLLETIADPEAAAPEAIEIIPPEQTPTRAYSNTFTGFVQTLVGEIYTCKRRSDGQPISCTIQANPGPFSRVPMRFFFFEYI